MYHFNVLSRIGPHPHPLELHSIWMQNIETNGTNQGSPTGVSVYVPRYSRGHQPTLSHEPIPSAC